LKIRRIISAFLLCTLALPISAAEVKIEGKAPAYPLRKISLNVYSDYLSLTLDKLTESSIDASGNFSLAYDFASVREVVLKIDGVSSFFYVQPGTTYKVQFPDIEKGRVKTFCNNQVQIEFDTLLTYDINNLILDFDEKLDNFVGHHFVMLGHKNFKTELDTFKRTIINRYKTINNPFFRDYVRYSFAGLEQIGGINVDMKMLKALLYKEYLSNGKIMYTHPKYMLFFNQFYTDVFKLTTEEEEIQIFKAIEHRKSPFHIGQVLRNDDFLKLDVVREMVIIKALSEEYFTRNFDQASIIQVLDSIGNFSVFEEHRKIASNMVKTLTRLGFGTEAPGFELLNEKDQQVTLNSFEGKYVYLQFWAEWNSGTLGEMKLMKEMQKCYGRDVVFISINLDESLATWKKYLKDHADFKWVHLHYSNYPEIIDLYKISNVSSYFLIGPDGKIVQSPALKPTPDGTFHSIDKTFFDLWRKLHPAEKKLPCNRS
jgi:thiol-disulfide isomerase/thioredoxin